MEVIDGRDLDLDNITCPYIKKAFECPADHITLMTIQEFIKVSGFPIDGFILDNFFHNLNDDIPVYVTNELIEWCGFGSKEFLHKKQEFNRLLKNFKEGEDYWSYTNKEYAEYYKKSISLARDIETNPESKEETLNAPHFPDPSEFIGKNKTKHIILTVWCFKNILMMLDTKKAEEIRIYYLALEKLIKTYMKYQLYQQKYQNRILNIALKEQRELAKSIEDKHIELLKKHDEIIKKNDLLLDEVKDVKEDLEVNNEILMDMNSKLDTATDERAPRTKSISKRDKFMIIKINDPDYPWSYYAIRVQQSSLKKTLKKNRLKYPKYTELITIPYQPNGINFFNLMKERLKDAEKKIMVFRNEIELKDGYPEEEFLQDIKALDMSKKEVDEEKSE
jgi:hypothetical protein